MTKFSANLGFLWSDLPLPEAIHAAKVAAAFSADTRAIPHGLWCYLLRQTSCEPKGWRQIERKKAHWFTGILQVGSSKLNLIDT